jgi:hypothetical protein
MSSANIPSSGGKVLAVPGRPAAEGPGRHQPARADTARGVSELLQGSPGRAGVARGGTGSDTARRRTVWGLDRWCRLLGEIGVGRNPPRQWAVLALTMPQETR